MLLYTSKRRLSGGGEKRLNRLLALNCKIVNLEGGATVIQSNEKAKLQVKNS
jgi:hypothetical protein